MSLPLFGPAPPEPQQPTRRTKRRLSHCCICGTWTINPTPRWPDDKPRFACPGLCAEIATERIIERFGFAHFNELDRKNRRR